MLRRCWSLTLISSAVSHTVAHNMCTCRFASNSSSRNSTQSRLALQEKVSLAAAAAPPLISQVQSLVNTSVDDKAHEAVMTPPSIDEIDPQTHSGGMRKKQRQKGQKKSSASPTQQSKEAHAGKRTDLRACTAMQALRTRKRGRRNQARKLKTDEALTRKVAAAADGSGTSISLNVLRRFLPQATIFNHGDAPVKQFGASEGDAAPFSSSSSSLPPSPRMGLAFHPGSPTARSPKAVEETLGGKINEGVITTRTKGSNAIYASLFQTSFVNPFNGRVISIHSPCARSLFRLGFVRSTSNPLHIAWSPQEYFRSFHAALKRLQKSPSSTMKKKKGCQGGARDSIKASGDDGADAEREEKETCEISTERVITSLLQPLYTGQGRLVPWRQELSDLIRHDDVLSIMNSEVERRYTDLASTYMPSKLDSTPDPSIADTVLTPDQANAAQLAKRGYSLYVGGSAGTGKTVLLKVIYRELTQMGLRVAITATTGVAAVQLGGCTFHRAFNAPIDASKITMSSSRRWDTNAMRSVDVAIIDEVSLLDAQLFDAFDIEARLARMDSRPFGGLQVVVCGDFLQLSNDTASECLPVYASAAFTELIPLKLVTPMRHAQDDPFLHFLNHLRRGVFDSELISTLDRPVPEDAQQITYIFPRRREAKSLNDEMLSRLPTEESLYAPENGPLQLVGRFTSTALIELPPTHTAKDAGTSAGDGITGVSLSRHEVVSIIQEEVAHACPAAGLISNLDCVVMPTRSAVPSIMVRLRHRDTSSLAAAAVTITEEEQHPSGDAAAPAHAAAKAAAGAVAIQKELWERTIADKIAQRLGGRLAAILQVEPASLLPNSIALDIADAKYGSVTDILAPLRLKPGCRVMVNRNLSRTVSNGSVGVVEGFSAPDPDLFPRRQEASSHTTYDRVLRQNYFKQLPVVRLLTDEVVQIPPVSIMLGGSPQSYYYGHEVHMLPLQLGYAFTVHKVQGLTLQGTVVLDCERFFECPHLIYVACSRVRSVDQLIVRNIKPEMVIVRRSALEFSENLKEARDPLILAPAADMHRASWTERVSPRVLSLRE